MSDHVAGPELNALIKELGRLPGLGPRSARRAVLHLLKQRERKLIPLKEALESVIETVTTCQTCGNLDTRQPCSICQMTGRDEGILCVLEDVPDLWAMERAAIFRGRYHVLGGVLSAMNGVGPEDLNITSLIDKAKSGHIREIVLALNVTVDGQTTAHYIAENLSETDVTITRLAHGVPVGGELEYLDEGTLATAMRARQSV